MNVSSIPGQGISPEQLSPKHLHDMIDIEEAGRQLELAAHDVAVASGCIGLGHLDRAPTSVITARAAVDAAENILRVALNLAAG